MSNRPKPTGSWAARMFPLHLNEGRTMQRRQRKSRQRAYRLPERMCGWDVRLGRDRGCHVRRQNPWSRCPAHDVPDVPLNWTSIDDGRTADHFPGRYA